MQVGPEIYKDDNTDLNKISVDTKEVAVLSQNITSEKEKINTAFETFKEGNTSFLKTYSGPSKTSYNKAIDTITTLMTNVSTTLDNLATAAEDYKVAVTNVNNTSQSAFPGIDMPF